MGTRANRLTRLFAASMVMLFATFGGACGSDASEEPAEPESEEVIKLDDPAPFDLPESCDELREFAAEARQAYDDAEVNTQELVDAKARFDGAVNEQMMLDCG